MFYKRLIRFSLMLMLGPALGLAADGAWTLSGTIYGGSTPMAGATVTATIAATGVQASSAQTDTNGLYSIQLDNGTYNLQVTPPSGSNFSSAVVNGVVINSANVSQNVVLVRPIVTLSGTVSGPGGTPARNIYVIAVDPDTQAEVATHVTLTDGQYTLSVPAGHYRIKLGAYTASNVPTPGIWFVDPFINDVNVAAATTLDLTLPAFVTLSGKTLSPTGSPVAGVEVKTDHQWISGGVQYICRAAATSDGSGNYSMILLPGLYPVTLVPPVGSGAAQTTFSNVDALQTGTRDFTMNAPVRLSGVVSSRGTLASNITVTAFPQGSITEIAHALTDAAGAYALELPAGTYNLKVSGDGTSNIQDPPYWWIDPQAANLAVTSDLTHDIAIPFVMLAGKTVNEQGQPVAGVQILFSVDELYATGIALNNYGKLVVSDAAGNYSMMLLSGPYRVTLTPPTNAGLAMIQYRNISVPGDTTHDLVLPKAKVLSGTVKDTEGTPLQGVQVRAQNQTTGQQFENGSTDAAGHYSIPLEAGSYQVNLSFFGPLNVPAPSVGVIDNLFGNITIDADTVRDITIPLVALSGRTTDANGVPVAGVSQSTSAYWDENGSHYIVELYNGNPTSDASGNYLTRLFPHIYDLTIKPPAQSGFLQTTVNGVNVTAPLQQNIILTFDDKLAPRILSGPHVDSITNKSATIKWLTDEPADSVVRYGIASVSENTTISAELVTAHTIQLTGLTPNTTYKIKVESTDKAGNGPVQSQEITFLTRPAPDTTPPVIEEGPVINSITQHSATVEWTTDEPATSLVRYGTTQTVNSTTSTLGLKIHHRVNLAKLAANTLYYVKASSQDRQGNGPTESPVISFRTLSARDTIPPVITAGPLAIQVTDTAATIAWTTDEPAGSGVSYNDGTHFGVARDDALVTEHAVRLTGLTPSKTYAYVVASLDAQGNGPTLSAKLTFQTQPATDASAPRITEGPLVVNITHQSAVIRWVTDEPADAVIEYGPTAALGLRTSRAELKRRHNLTVTGLNMDTTYTFRVLSTDGHGNGPSSSALQTFHTSAQKDTTPPVYLDGPRVVAKTDHTCTLYWRTDEPADTVVEYGIGTLRNLRASLAARTLEHKITLANLDANTTYTFETISTDIDGNAARAGQGGLPQAAPRRTPALPPAGVSFTTNASPDTMPPAFSTAPQVLSVSATTAVVRWVTNELADSRLSYGLQGQARSMFTGDIEPALEHLVVLTNLNASTAYALQAQSADVSGNLSAVSAVVNFTTTATPDRTAPVITTQPAAAPVTANQALIAWGTGEFATSEVRFGKSPVQLYNSAALAGLSPTHAVTLTGLTSSTMYYYVAISTDAAGNTTVSPVQTFRTPFDSAFPPDIDADKTALNYLEGTHYAVDVTRGYMPMVQDLKLRNIGTGTLTISNITLSGTNAGEFQLLSQPALPWVLAPGATEYLAVVFAPRMSQRTLNLLATLTITSDDPDEGTLAIPLRGDAVPVELTRFTAE